MCMKLQTSLNNMYGITTPDQISDKLLNTYSEWDKYVAHLWYNFLYFCEIKTQDTVIEIAPGASPKLVMALAKINFQGKVYIVEPFKEALDHITHQYQTYLPQVQIFPIQKNLLESMSFLPKNPDFIVSHHPLDDMLISSNLEASEVKDIFNWVKQDKLEIDVAFEKRWLDIQSDPRALELMKENIVKLWCDLIEVVNPKFLILSQYPSLVLEQYKTPMSDLNKAAQNILWQIKTKIKTNLEPQGNIQTLLNANKNYNFPLIVQ